MLHDDSFCWFQPYPSWLTGCFPSQFKKVTFQAEFCFGVILRLGRRIKLVDRILFLPSLSFWGMILASPVTACDSLGCKREACFTPGLTFEGYRCSLSADPEMAGFSLLLFVVVPGGGAG